MTAALMDRDEQDDQDIWLEMCYGPHGAFYNALGKAALCADNYNRQLIKAMWQGIFDQCKWLVEKRRGESNK